MKDVLFTTLSGQKALEKATGRAEYVMKKNCIILNRLWLSYRPVWEELGSVPSFPEGFWEEPGFSGGTQMCFIPNIQSPEA